MAHPLTDTLRALERLRPSNVRALARTRVSQLLLRELGRARARVYELERQYPSLPVRERAQRLIDAKKQLAGMIGGVSGVFGLAAVPADLLVMTWLQLELLVDIATLYKVNLKGEGARAELLDVFGHASGVGPLTRVGPQLLGRLAGTVFRSRGLSLLGRAVPLVASPLTAYLNNQHIQAVGEEAVRHYGGFERAKQKARSTASP